ncbi:MAG TPA: type II toxin-antitoxin system VapC family toxin [Blastocatellia bacterium]|nr:type II toxin-antitoxin system VapC family toxin [Blastocatellia bacterium]HNG28514.1 type II toxin-antitoxin system VapC family toxin [Blastocatellia bacterium]
MKTLVVDTDVISYLFKGDSRAAVYRQHLQNATPLVSFMTVAELEYWALIRNWGEATRQRMQTHLSAYTQIMPDSEMCRLWAEVYLSVNSSGRKISVQDAWIAATAISYQVPLVTHNRKDYAIVSGLTLISEAPQ